MMAETETDHNPQHPLIAHFPDVEAVADTSKAALDVTNKFQDQTKESDKRSITVNELDIGLEWLDDQPTGHVIFFPFGCSETVSFKQLSTELALGVEMSRERFLWVVKSPNNTSSNAAFLGAQSQDDPLSFLPKGLLDRIKGQDLVVPSWAPQIEVLAHGSTGAFVKHCGCNSTLEGVVNGLLLIAWPLYAVLKTNAKLLTGGLNTARLRVDKNGPSRGREGIVNVAKELMKWRRREETSRSNEEIKVTLCHQYVYCCCVKVKF